MQVEHTRNCYQMTSSKNRYLWRSFYLVEVNLTNYVQQRNSKVYYKVFDHVKYCTYMMHICKTKQSMSKYNTFYLLVKYVFACCFFFENDYR